MSVGRVGGTDNHNVAQRQQFLLAYDGRILSELIGVQDRCTVKSQYFPDFVGQRVPDVVYIGFEGHSENSHLLGCQIVFVPQLVDDEVGKSFIDHHGCVAENKIIAVEGGQLHRVLEQARPGGKACARQRRGPAVAVHHHLADVVVVHTETTADHVKLIRHGELDIAPSVGKEFDQFGLGDG